MARRGAKSAGFWMIQRQKRENQINIVLSVLYEIEIPFAVSINAFCLMIQNQKDDNVIIDRTPVESELNLYVAMGDSYGFVLGN